MALAAMGGAAALEVMADAGGLSGEAEQVYALEAVAAVAKGQQR
jgi:hypothetical protein